MDPEQTSGELGADIQGNVLCGFSKEHALFAFYEVADAAKARSWLGALKITDGSAGADPKMPGIARTVAFTAFGLSALGVREEVLARFPQSFRSGMTARHGELGDPADREGWDPVFAEPSKIHILLSLYAEDDCELESSLETLADDEAVRRLDVQPTRMQERREHFGFRDGISQPVRRDGADRWQSDLPIREFLVFKESWNQGDGADGDPDLELARLGSFLVYRKLEQDVFAFREFVQRWFPIDADHMAARIMGRWPNGAPVRRDLQPESERGQPNDENGFDFSDDESGTHCPVGAHIRRANPRASLAFRADRHRMIRHGRPYGPAAPEISSFKERVADPDGEQRGLIFQALVSDIPRQFEFVQRAWINSQGFQGLDGTDPISATEARGNFRLASGRGHPLWQFVSLKGGEYFFVPGMQAIDGLAGGEFG
jgi:Dyp-type peroxidase family